jgi:hypothetical protein
VPHRFRLGETGQADRVGAFEITETRCKGRRFVEVDAGHVGAPDLEQQRFLDLQGAIAGESGALFCAHCVARFGGASLSVQHVLVPMI